MKRTAFILFILTASAPLFAQEGYTITRIVFLPPTFYVGDEVEMRLRIKPDPGKTIQAPGEMPELSWLRVDHATLITGENEAEFRLGFSTFQPGTRSLPDISLGDIVLKDIKIHTTSVLGPDQNTLAPLRDQMYLPGTKFYIVLFVAVIIFLPVVLVPLTRFLRKKISQTLVKSREGRVYRRFQKEIKYIQDRMETLDSREFYILLTESLRRYLWKRTGKDFITTTSREIRNLMRVTLPDQSIQRSILKVFTTGDRVKFGGTSEGTKTRNRNLALVLESAEKIEHRYTEKEESVRVDH